jgi:two-component system sensor kinase FixL
MMSKYFRSRPAHQLSLRRYLIRLVLLLVIPSSVFGSALVLLLARHEKADIRSRMEATSRALRIMVDWELESATRTLQSLTASTDLLTGDLEGFRGHAERVLEMQKGWENITLIDRSGKNLVSLRTTLAHQVLDRDHFELVMFSGKPAVQNLKEDRLVGITVPVLVDGKTEYVVNACLRADLFADLLTRENLPPPWLGAIYDGEGHVVGWSHSEAVEHLAEPDLTQSMSKADKGWATARTLDGLVSYVSFNKSAASQWSAAIAVPSVALDIPVYRRLFIVVASGLMIVIAGSWMALISARRLARPVEKLSENSTALGRGSFSVKPTSSVKEIRALEESFQKADSELHDLATELEQRLHERTAQLQRQIAEKDRAEENLRWQAELLELSHEGILVRSFSDSRIRFWSSGATRLYGWKKEEALGKISHELLQTHFPQALEEIEDQLSRYGSWDGELIHTNKDGARVNVVSRWSLRRDQTGQPFDVFELASDISEKKNAEQKLLENERLASLGLTAAVFAHEVANPLHNLNSTLVLLDRELANTGDIHSGLKLARAATGEIRRLNMLLDEFRSLARPQSLSRQPVNFREIVEEVLASMRPAQESAKIIFELDFDDALPPVLANRDKIKQVFVNLCKNAVEAMPAGGRLTVKSYCSGTSAIFQVSDTGLGIPPGLEVFHLFTTTKPHGTGLGLAIVKQIICAHGGTIDYVSQPGQETTFTISLPLHTNEPEQTGTMGEV